MTTVFFLDHFITFLGGLIVAYVAFKLQHNNQKVTRNVSVDCNAIQLFNIHEKAPKELKVVLEKSKNFQNEMNQNSAIESACAHLLKIKNRGNKEADQVYIDISFESETDIISFSCNDLGNTEYDMSINRKDKEPNTLNVYLPYLNVDDVIELSVLTTGKSADKEPKIFGRGKGVKINKYSPTISWGYVLLLILLLVPIQFSWSGFTVESKNFIIGPVPTTMVNTLGGTIEEKVTYLATFPLYLCVLYTVVSAFLIFLLAKKIYQRYKF